MNKIDLLIMNKIDLLNAICELRCRAEELQEIARDMWCNSIIEDEDYEIYDLELGYVAYRLGELEEYQED